MRAGKERQKGLTLASGEMTGPSATSASKPLPSLRVWALATKSLTQSLAAPTKMATDSAMQRCPAAPKAAPTICERAASLSASGSTTAWFLAAMLLCTRLPLAVPRA